MRSKRIIAGAALAAAGALVFSGCSGGSAEGDVCVPGPARAGAPLWLRVPARAALLGCSRSLPPRRLPHGRAGSAALRAPSCEVGGYGQTRDAALQPKFLALEMKTVSTS